ncbi:MAG TPA: 3-methyl-2-oxobutanoate hydroxymethyltransferase [Roseomonas sp.]|jgi:3-methyl-2-oxobutanoate hydroxymethyltransferase
MAYLQDAKPIRLGDFARMAAKGEKIASLTCYDSSFAALLDRNGVELFLVGDSMGNVLQGHGSTLPVTLEQVEYHTACVLRGTKRAMVMADLPFGSYQESREQAFRSAARLMAAGAQMVKIEGGAWLAGTVRFLVERGIPVCAHIGLTPQSVNTLGGYRVQGARPEAAARLEADAKAMEDAGASLCVIEMVPAALGEAITAACPRMPTIGIGAGPGCAGQILVLHDMIGVYPGKTARFTKDFLADAGGIDAAIAAYVAAVKEGRFPAPEHCY